MPLRNIAKDLLRDAVRKLHRSGRGGKSGGRLTCQFCTGVSPLLLAGRSLHRKCSAGMLTSCTPLTESTASSHVMVMNCGTCDDDSPPGAVGQSARWLGEQGYAAAARARQHKLCMIILAGGGMELGYLLLLLLLWVPVLLAPATTAPALAAR